MRALLGWTSMLVLLCGCSQFSKDGASCPDTACSSHGVCTYQDTYPSCACAEGYDGVVCSRCAQGFHRATDDSCVADEVCTPGACGANGACQVEEGRVVCACTLGFTGATCTECRAGYHRTTEGSCELDLTCLPSSCADAGACSEDAGRVTCQCPADRTGAYCEQRIGSCAMGDPCSAHGRCVDTSGLVRCVCQPGYGGPTCETCYPGYAATDAGCVAGEACTASTCSFVGTCTADGGLTDCACNAGYTGGHCERCTTGFHRSSDFRCVADEDCTAHNRCSSGGTCRVEAGATVCDCLPGFAGVTCSECYPGYHAQVGADGGADCALDTTCRADTCRFHGQCSDDAGVAQCQCATGFSGSNCQTNIDDCVNSACNGRQCIDLINSNVCLCDGGVYAQVCP